MRNYLSSRAKRYDRSVRELAAGLTPQIKLIFLLFMTGLLLGLLNTLDINFYANLISGQLKEMFKGYHGYSLFVKILFHNLSAAAVAIYSGIFLAVIPIFSTIANGALIGGLSNNIHVSESLSGFEIFLLLLPHGVFEIPALLLSLALGIKLGSWPFKRNKKQFIKECLKAATRGYLQIIIPLLILAAIIETIGIEAWR